MKKLCAALSIAIVAGGAARGADLPITKEATAAPPPPVNCFSSLWTWLDSTAADCPLSWGPFTVYATLDGGLSYESHGAGYNAAWNVGVSNPVSKQSSPAPSGCGHRMGSASRSSASR